MSRAARTTLHSYITESLCPTPLADVGPHQHPPRSIPPWCSPVRTPWPSARASTQNSPPPFHRLHRWRQQRQLHKEANSLWRGSPPRATPTGRHAAWHRGLRRPRQQHHQLRRTMEPRNGPLSLPHQLPAGRHTTLSHRQRARCVSRHQTPKTQNPTARSLMLCENSTTAHSRTGLSSSSGSRPTLA